MSPVLDGGNADERRCFGPRRTIRVVEYHFMPSIWRRMVLFATTRPERSATRIMPHHAYEQVLSSAKLGWRGEGLYFGR